jgi:hypothetical protein
VESTCASAGRGSVSGEGEVIVPGGGRRGRTVTTWVEGEGGHATRVDAEESRRGPRVRPLPSPSPPRQSSSRSCILLIRGRKGLLANGPPSTFPAIQLMPFFPLCCWIGLIRNACRREMQQTCSVTYERIRRSMHHTSRCAVLARDIFLGGKGALCGTTTGRHAKTPTNSSSFRSARFASALL